MATDKKLLIKGLQRLVYTLGLMFAGPVVLYQAFKNEDHPFYIPVLVFGAILAIGAVAMGFYSIKTLLDALFGSKK
ncbi:DUF6095 family protein [Robiginitalea sp. SC105]|uniref:DUF6095 family protein n=1 Tax=Robiginitalea sp. SC105 TaxID=2762332 RepID=UPI00163AC6BC|nr:DUF6095 family protein [Robiginitalea sp. SC105]MBC2840145.1 hypothetical protein [Robiginitalea sp. SC105]